MQDDDKVAAARAAVAEVRDGMLVGLGTGSTASHAIRLIAEQARAGLRVEAVATSEASATLARSLGLTVLDFATVSRVDLTIDGVDEIDSCCRAVKGAGGAMVREKIVAEASDRMIAIADGTKRVERLGAALLPVEVLPFAAAFVLRHLSGMALAAEVRAAGAKPYWTDQGNLILDCAGLDPEALDDTAQAIDALPGVLGHGLFLREIDAAFIARDGQVEQLLAQTVT
ncbi:ribose-5-phosphate isomerase [Sphingomonas gellani]|uniref:Ribose-5-phosphate isomerase A n=1 Tax=Sphingomonas gellani TaxID=1166340 RepID=A0A1H8F194_9SPHN|nr:ribose-5-phosphate isomerase RpiA [Sphingomonas gellani]SEN25400.1 ribose-5-phosphate isomerase [Sphingomonas gellani]